MKKKIGEACKDIDVSLAYENGEQQVLLNGENVNAFIRTEEVSMMTSDTSKYKKVREKLLDLQRNLAKTQNVIMDGRDIGTCVLPDAPLKIYLTASSKERARRRYKEQQERGIECDFEQIEKDIIARDKQDMNRAVAPLKKADDAVVVDASDMTIEEVVRKFMDLYKVKKCKIKSKKEGRRMEVTVAKSAGFCFGVKRAVDMVYEEAKKNTKVYTLGPIIHNEQVVQDLESKGVQVLHSIDELKEEEDAVVIIRSHGITKQMQDASRKKRYFHRRCDLPVCKKDP